MDIITKEWAKKRKACFNDASLGAMYGVSGLTKIEVLTFPLGTFADLDDNPKELIREHLLWTVFHHEVIAPRQMFRLLKLGLERLPTTNTKLLRVRDWMNDPDRVGDFNRESFDAVSVIDFGAGGHVGKVHARAIIAMRLMRKGSASHERASRLAFSVLLEIFEEMPDPTIGHQWAIDQLILILTP